MEEMENSKIEWTDHTFNPWWGCMKVSPGCKNCYAETLSKRYGKGIWGPSATTVREKKQGVWKDILLWDKKAKADGVRRRVFVSSMSDFLEDHPMVFDWRLEAMRIIENLNWLDVLILTKRPENAERFLGDWFRAWPPHVWFGASVENQRMADERIPELVRVPAPVRFLSVEPMLEGISLHRWLPPVAAGWMPELHWVIVGGESGPRCRPFDVEWARAIRDQCRDANVPFFMKQIGGHPYKRDRLADFPEDLRVREFPVGLLVPVAEMVEQVRLL
jgi:protein gp37